MLCGVRSTSLVPADRTESATAKPATTSQRTDEGVVALGVDHIRTAVLADAHHGVPTSLDFGRQTDLFIGKSPGSIVRSTNAGRRVHVKTQGERA